MRSQLQVTKDNVPAHLKEIFDLFMEVHSKKAYLVTRRLVTDEHKDMIRMAVLDCCAMCGPDNIAPPNDKNKGVKPAAGKN